jgi:hypothetical protein
VKVPYVEDKTTRGGFGSPSEADLSRMIRSEVESWTPRRGPDWTDILIRIASSGPSAWMVYTTASAALVVILIAAFLVGSALDLGGLGLQPAQVHLKH